MKSHEDEAKEEKGEEEEVEVFARWPRPRGGEGGVGRKVGRGGGGLTTVFMHARRIFLFSFFCVRVRVVRRGEGRGRVPAYHTPRAKEEGGREGGCVCDGSPSSSDVIRLEGEEVALEEEEEEDCHQRSLLHNLDGPKFACWIRRRRTKCAIISSLRLLLYAT